MLKQVSRQSAGEIRVLDRETGKLLFEGSLRQCIHCQFTWTYRQGSGHLSGFCFKCNGFICHKLACQECYHKERRVEDIENVAFRNKQAIEAAVRQQAWRERVFSDRKRLRSPL
jgi:hypothetical protein